MNAEREARLARIAAVYPEAAAEAREAWRASPPRWNVEPGRSVTLDDAHAFSIAANAYGTGLGAADLDALTRYLVELLNARPAEEWPAYFRAYMAAPVGEYPTLPESQRERAEADAILRAGPHAGVRCTFDTHRSDAAEPMG